MSEQKARPALLALALLVACGGRKEETITTGTAGITAPRPSEAGMLTGTAPPELAFSIPAGDISNHFYRRGGVADRSVSDGNRATDRVIMGGMGMGGAGSRCTWPR